MKGRGEDLSIQIEELKEAFLETPSAEGLKELYRALLEVGEDHILAGVLDKVRPIQHRVTLVQADADVETLEALARDPHVQVRRVVAAHPRISEEVAFRLSEDLQGVVRRALRKNPACHPLLAAAVTMRDGPARAADSATPEHLLEIAWQARRVGITAGELVELSEEWLEVGRDELESLSLEQAGLLLEVLAAKLGQGKMPSKPRKKKAAKKKKVAKKKSRG